MGEKIKKLVAGITLGLMVVVGVGVGGQAVKAIDDSTVEVTRDFQEEDVTYEENTIDLIKALVENGVMSKEEGDLEIAFYSAQTHEEKQNAYDELIDYQVKIGDITEETGNKLKEAGYDAPWEVVQKIYVNGAFDEMVKEGLIAKEEADLQIAFLTAETHQDKQKAYEDIIDYEVKMGAYSKEDGDKLKAAGYDGAYEVEVELYLQSLDGMVKEGLISQEQANLEKAYLTAKTDEDRKKAYDALVDYSVAQGQITPEEGEEIKALGFEF